jgi:HD-GYP domain-containing protein (c-di-GMP phosphodiesterase class II)
MAQEQQRHKTAKKVASPGERLLHSMFRLLQVVKIHQSNNKLFAENVELFRQALDEIWRETETIDFMLHRGRFYLNDERIVYTPSMWSTSSKMAELFHARGIDGVRFICKGPLTQDQIVGFMDAFNRALKAPDPTAWLEQTLKEGFPWVEVSKESDKDVYSDEDASDDASPGGRKTLVRGGGAKSSPFVARQIYSTTLTALRTIVERLSAGKAAGVQKSKRAIESLIDFLFEDEENTLLLSTVRDAGDQVYTHSVNTAVLSMCMGKKLGLGRASLEQLGLAALFHDLGKTGRLAEVISKPERLTGVEKRKAEGHALLSVLSIIRLNATHALKHSLLAPAGEHHMGLNRSGYPRAGDPTEPISLFGRLIAAADQYDALTSERPWREPIAPHDALIILMKEAGTTIDPVVMKLLVSLLGSWPPGSVLLLDTHEAALAHFTVSAEVGARPSAIILNRNPDGTFSPGESIDLNETDPATGLFRRNIVSSVHPHSLGIQPLDLLFPSGPGDPPKRRPAMADAPAVPA